MNLKSEPRKTKIMQWQIAISDHHLWAVVLCTGGGAVGASTVAAGAEVDAEPAPGVADAGGDDAGAPTAATHGSNG